MAKTTKVPKRIAGVRLPKPLRRSLRDLSASKSGRAALAEAFAAAGLALTVPPSPAVAEAPTAAGKAKRGARTAKAAPDSPHAATVDDRAAALAALEDAVRSFTDTLRRRGMGEPPPPAAAASAAAPPSTATH